MTAKSLATPVGFARGVLGQSLWRAQAEILNSVQHNRRTAVKSCHASGKSFVSASVVLWWVTSYPDAIAVTTAPTNRQVKDVLWGEIRNSARNSRIPYPKILTQELRLGDKNFAIGLSTNEADRFQGFHSGRVLIVLDEAPGVRNEVWNAVQGLMAGGSVRLLAIGNPTITGGPFHDAFTSSRALWSTHTINAFDTPNLQRCSLEVREGDTVTVIGSGKNLMELSEEELDAAARPYLCTRRWVREMYEEWGSGHPYFQSKILGDFPTESDDSLIPLSWLERAKTTPLDDLPKGARYVAGLDVAGPGESETVLVVRRGPRVEKLCAWTSSDPRGDVVAALGQYRGELERVNVDSVGIGWNMYTHLCDVFGKSIVRAVNVGVPARNKEKYVNSKAEYYWGLRLRAQAGDIQLAPTVAESRDWERTVGQLAVIRYAHNARGRIEIESKDEMRRRGVRSPDRAEAVMLAFIDRAAGDVPKMFFSTGA